MSGMMAGWSDAPRLRYRLTSPVPHRSAIIGMLAAAMGIPRGDDLSLFDDLEISVADCATPELMSDFQTIRNAVTYDGAAGRSAITHRHYVVDPCVTVVVSGDDALIQRIKGALKCPHWQPYLGRRNCVPSQPLIGCE